MASTCLSFFCLSNLSNSTLNSWSSFSSSSSIRFNSVKNNSRIIVSLSSRVGPVVFKLSDLHKLMVEAAEVLNIEAPDLYVRQKPVLNAYTLAVSGRKPFVVVHTSLVELLTRRELHAFLAHELGHLKCDHGVWLTLANRAVHRVGRVGFGLTRFGGIIAQRLEEQLFQVVVSVLMKLAGGCPSLSDQLNVDAFLEQARYYDKASSSPFGWYIRNAQTSQLSHPLPVLRAREIDEWSKSQEYKSLLSRARRISSAKNV
ncbi:hypothetical protein MKX01_038960 [Papaver californicum]|nr:hypothetical protein MKX01_038960 [Papaver californicum]